MMMNSRLEMTPSRSLLPVQQLEKNVSNNIIRVCIWSLVTILQYLLIMLMSRKKFCIWVEGADRKKQVSTQPHFFFWLVFYMHLVSYHVSSLITPQPLLLQLLVPVLLFSLMPCCLPVLITVLVICLENPSFSPLPWLSLALASLCLPASVGQQYQFFHTGNCFTFCPSSFCLTLFAGVSFHICYQFWISLALDWPRLTQIFVCCPFPISASFHFITVFHLIFLPVHRFLDDLFKV